MLLDDFRRIVTAFADHEADLDLSKGVLLTQIRDELIEAKLSQQGGQLIVDEQGQRLPASTWIITRIARVPLLADRILSYVPETEGFVTPSGRLLDQPDFSRGSDESDHADAKACALEVLGRRPAGTASVLYLTSDAGEGKTTLINHLARHQASEFKAKRSDWLLVPIPLGGRTFLRFDDVVIAALVNRLRFQLLYCDAFIELVRLGVLIPAFDGFEEMIIESSSGEAISALGNLVRSLKSAGSALVAARKAYFDYHSFKAQARLFDAVGSDSVAFARLALNRWNREQFLTYAGNRGLQNAQATYSAVAERLRADHPLLTRAVLVRRLVDVASATPDLSELLNQIGTAPQDYFFQFVSALVDREAREKWIDQSGEPHQPLLSVDEHHELLGMVAQEMWLSSTDALRPDVIATIGDVFSETKKKAPPVSRQIRERLKQHSLLVSSGAPGGALAFDHEDFRTFYLGEAIGRVLEASVRDELRSLLQVGILPRAAADKAVLYVRRRNVDASAAVSRLQALASSELPASFVRESCGVLAIGLVESISPAELTSMNFPEDALRRRTLSGLTVREGYFQASSLAGATLRNCTFVNCRFERLELSPDCHIEAVLDRCDVGSVMRVDRDDQLFDPSQIKLALQQYGFTLRDDQQAPLPLQTREPDVELWLVERVIRIFLRANQVNEDVIRMKLGVRAGQFVDDVLPGLVRVRVLEEIPYLGAGAQRRFRLRVPMQRLQDALTQCGGDYQRFLAIVGGA